jgi:hypothetical protein
VAGFTNIMKGPPVVLASLALVLASCETGEINAGGSFDPLTAPGSGRATPVAQTGLRPGSYARTNIDNAAFFKKRPSGDAAADRQLPANTEVKVISDDGSFVKVELNSGEVGFIPSVLVGDQNAATTTSPDAIQVYPPVPGSVPPVLDDSNIPTIPPVIDPDAPVNPDLPPVPDAPPVPAADAPPVPPASTPLPPGVGEEELPPVEGGNF